MVIACAPGSRRPRHHAGGDRSLAGGQAVGIGGHTIPAGAIACPNIYLVQRRADLYQDPAAFRPDRFVGRTPPAFGWFPFGGGIRRCLGASFATFEMRIVVPEVLRAVTFVPHDGARCVVTARSQPRAQPLKTMHGTSDKHAARSASN